MRKLLLLGALIGALAVPGAAQAASPHFVGTPSCSLSLTSGLTCSGKAAGLANEPTAAFLTASSVSATYECVNHGGNVAPGQPTVQQDVTGPVVQIAPHNGQITFSVSLAAPTPPSSADTCPNGNWTVRRTSLTFSGVVLHLQQNGTDLLTRDFGTFSA